VIRLLFSGLMIFSKESSFLSFFWLFSEQDQPSGGGFDLYCSLNISTTEQIHAAYKKHKGSVGYAIFNFFFNIFFFVVSF
jgi:hypothetical protein